MCVERSQDIYNFQVELTGDGGEAVISGGSWVDIYKKTWFLNNRLYDELTDEQDISVRYVVKILVYEDESVVSDIFKDSEHCDRLVLINNLLHSEESGDRILGARGLYRFVDDYQDYLLGKDERNE